MRKQKDALLDRTGSAAGLNQDAASPVWFLTCTDGGAANRMTNVAADKALFFPIINELSWIPADGKTEKTLRDVTKKRINSVIDLEVQLDGKPVADLKPFRVESSLFTFTGPEKVSDEVFRGVSGEHQ